MINRKLGGHLPQRGAQLPYHPRSRHGRAALTLLPIEGEGGAQILSSWRLVQWCVHWYFPFTLSLAAWASVNVMPPVKMTLHVYPLEDLCSRSRAVRQSSVSLWMRARVVTWTGFDVRDGSWVEGNRHAYSMTWGQTTIDVGRSSTIRDWSIV